MSGIKTTDYKRFYAHLEANGNKLLKHLIDEIDDASVNFLTDKKNYTNFIGALVWMFNHNPASIEDRWGKNEEDFAKITLNLDPIGYDSSNSKSISTYSSKYNEAKYIASTGKIELYDVYKETSIIPSYTIGGAVVSTKTKRELITEVSPLTPLIIVPDKDKLPLMKTALEGNDLGNKVYIVPAIFLKYSKDKIRNDYIEKGVITTLDVATIALSGGTALATKVYWVRRAWALVEVVGSVGNIVVNTQDIDPNSSLGQVVNSYNLAMGVIGIKNLGQAGYKFAKNLPQATKELLQKNGSLRAKLISYYQKWQTEVAQLDNPSQAEKQLVEKQAEVWKMLLNVLPPHTYLYNPNMTNRIKQIILKSGVSMEEFVNINYKASHGLASSKEINWLQDFVIKNFPKPQQGDRLRKVISIETMNNWQLGRNNPILKGNGFVTKADDYIIPKSSEELIENLRLDYQGTPFTKDKGFAVIEFENDLRFNIDHAFKTSQNNNPLPYTKTGMTGSKTNIIPEYVNQNDIIFKGGETMTVYDNKGNIVSRYEYIGFDENNKVLVNKWIKK